MNTTTPEPPRLLDRRKLLWWSFWFVAVGTPIFLALIGFWIGRLDLPGWVGSAAVAAVIGSLVTGAFVAGFLLASLTAKGRYDVILRTFSFGLSLLSLYVLLIMAGCSIVYVRF